MPFRASPFIDFNTDTVITPPMALIAKIPRPWTLDQKIEIYECMVDVWQLGAAVAMVKQIEAHQPPSAWSHSAYALVSIAFTYFEMIGKSLNPNSAASGTAGTDFNTGFCDVYPTYKPANGNYDDKIPQPVGKALPNPDIQRVVRIRDRVRNGIYHLGYTKGAVVLHNQKPIDFDEQSVPDPANPGTNITVYPVNPHTFVRTVVDHFPGFIARLRVATNTTMRQKFEAFFDQFLAP
ncbi:MAG: hypothetical protein KDA71_21295 [Planctomycetales bacterium]|nr:hypothetical protein [Planctomycetales bacterium]